MRRAGRVRRRRLNALARPPMGDGGPRESPPERAAAYRRATAARAGHRARDARAVAAVELVEHQHGASELARLHRAERLVHVLELAATADHLVELQPSLAVELDVARHVHLEAVAAHAAALDLLLAQEHGPVELDLLADRDHPDDGRRAAGTDAVEALLGRDLQTDGLEGIIHASVGHRADHLRGVVGLGVDRVRGAQLARLLELRLDRVDGDDHPRPRDARALDRRQTHTAGAEDGHRGTWLDPRRVQRRAD